MPGAKRLYKSSIIRDRRGRSTPIMLIPLVISPRVPLASHFDQEFSARAYTQISGVALLYMAAVGGINAILNIFCPVGSLLQETSPRLLVARDRPNTHLPKRIMCSFRGKQALVPFGMVGLLPRRCGKHRMNVLTPAVLADFICRSHLGFA